MDRVGMGWVEMGWDGLEIPDVGSFTITALLRGANKALHRIRWPQDFSPFPQCAILEIGMIHFIAHSSFLLLGNHLLN